MNFLSSSDNVKGIEVLYFDDAEVEKYKGSYESFGATGPLRVVYYKDYHRFVLELNDWKYPLIRRLPVILTSDKKNSSHRTYTLPGNNGFTFQLKINSFPSLQAMINLETILNHNSIFSLKGEDFTSRKLESSPDDKLTRHHNKDTGPKEIISEKVASFVHKMKVKAKSIQGGTKYLTSTKHRIDLKSIKNKDYKKTAKPTIKKGFFRHGDINTYEFMQKRRSNINLTEAKDLSDLMKSSYAPICTINREDLEEAILKNKELASSGKFATLEKEEKKGMMQNIKESMFNVGQKLSTGGRDTATTLKEEKFTQLESTHHSEA